MALYHFHVTRVLRSKGQSSVEAAAYRAGEKLTDHYYGKTADYTHKGGVICSEILAPDFVPEQFLDRETLWNAVEEIEKHAKKEIILIDGYVDVITLNIMAKKNTGVNVLVYTFPSAKITAQDITNFNAQYPTLTVKKTTAFHDRFLIIDGNEGYHIGASLKDAGKKCFGINKIEGIDVINNLIKKAAQMSK
ncbi:MAG: MobA/MobL family protein [Oribacterium sp.]|nr:MobA/MobL family protein [Oribacterium sp.]